jgi:hypothetical protein
MSNKYKVSRNKIEVLTANYPLLTGEKTSKKGNIATETR